MKKIGVFVLIILPVMVIYFSGESLFFGFNERNKPGDDLDVDTNPKFPYNIGRSVSYNIPKLSKNKFISKFKRDRIAEINVITYDFKQKKISHLHGKSIVKAEQKFALNVQSIQFDLYFYAFYVRKNKVKRLFPKGDKLLDKNPIQEDVAYNIPSDDKWERFSKKAGKETIFVFLTKKKNKRLAKTKSVRTLNKMLKRYRSAKSSLVTDKIEIKKGSISGSVNSRMFAFKKGFAGKIEIKNEGLR